MFGLRRGVPNLPRPIPPPPRRSGGVVENTLQMPECETTIYQPKRFRAKVGNVEIVAGDHCSWEVKVDGVPVKRITGAVLTLKMDHDVTVEVTTLPDFSEKRTAERQ